MEFPKVGRGLAKLATNEDMEKDAHGITNPNLHRRVDAKDPPENSDEVLPRDYQFSISGYNSYRKTSNHIQDENSDIVETP